VAILSAAALGFGCGARSSLSADRNRGTDGTDEPSNEFCARAEYRGGFSEVSLYLLLDASLSMDLTDMWLQATAAVSAFVDDPAMAGMGFGLQYFPLSSCDSELYAQPAVPIDILPNNASQVKTSLANHNPTGDTPTRPALRGGIEYARAMQLAEPTRAVAVALVTDGAPNACNSTVNNVSAIAADGSASEPQVLTYVIGFESAYLDVLGKIAAAGGTGQPVIIDEEQKAQQLVSALRSMRDSLQACRYAVPPIPGANPVAADVSVSFALAPSTTPTQLDRVAAESACNGHGFHVDDPSKPTQVQLCPVSCNAVHSEKTAYVEVTAGCGQGAPLSDAGASQDGGECSGSVSFHCVSVCGSTDLITPICNNGTWTCPAGTVSTESCDNCPPVPHGCCFTDGTMAMASCIAGGWVCPPGSVIFGSQGCSPPEVCAASLPCPFGQFCQFDDFTCGTSTLLGSCQQIPTNCTGPEVPTCGCDGSVHASTCAAAMAGLDAADTANCPPVVDHFSCGPLFCRITDQICRKTSKLYLPNAQNSYTCLAKPPTCPTGCDCDLCDPCPVGKACTESCSLVPSGGYVLTCVQL